MDGGYIATAIFLKAPLLSGALFLAQKNWLTRERYFCFFFHRFGFPEVLLSALFLYHTLTCQLNSWEIFFFPTLAHHTIPNGLCSVYSQRHRVSPGHDSPQRTPISKQAVKVSLPLPSEYLQQYVRDERARQQKHRAKIRSYEKCPPPRSHVDNMMVTTHTTIIKQYLDTREKKHFPSHPHEGDKISEKNIFL